jgi:hypothetical protein
MNVPMVELVGLLESGVGEVSDWEQLELERHLPRAALCGKPKGATSLINFFVSARKLAILILFINYDAVELSSQAGVHH